MKKDYDMSNCDSLLEAYQSDSSVRERLNELGLFITTDKNISVSFYITKEILSASEYHDFTELSLHLSENDSITLLIDSPGGYLSGAQMIVMALNSTKAYTTAVVINEAASAATIIALSCDALIMREHSSFMIHNVSFGSYGKGHEIKSHVDFSLSQSKKLLEATYEYFLTPEEIEEVLKGDDKYFDDEETDLRWSYVIEAREKDIQTAKAEGIANHIKALKDSIANLEKQLTEPEDTDGPIVEPEDTDGPIVVFKKVTT